jgi:transcriptional regulator
VYVPAHFAVSDIAWAHRLIEANSFALLVTVGDDGAPFATPIPILLDRDRGAKGTLLGHLARANPQWRHFAAGRPALAIFQGPHAYVSPSWYKSSPQVPTWNYVAVHARGVPAIIADEARIRDHQRRLVETFEGGRPNRWRMEDLPAAYVAGMIKGIVAFEMSIDALDAKAKLSQNRAAADHAGAIAGLKATGDAMDLDVARLMEEALARDGG